MVLNLENQGYLYTAQPDEIYSKIKLILETRPGIKRLDDRQRIVQKIKELV